jgi:hypothetical protein
MTVDKSEQGLSAEELAAESVSALPDKEVVSILDLDLDVDLAIDAAAPIDLAVAANANIAAPIDAAVSGNILSEGSTAQALSDQGVIIDQGLDADATATSDQTSGIDQGNDVVAAGTTDPATATDPAAATDPDAATLAADGTGGLVDGAVDGATGAVGSAVDGTDGTLDGTVGGVTDGVTGTTDGVGGVVDGVGEPGQAGQGLLAEVHLLAVRAALGGHRDVGHGRHRDAAGGDAPVELDELVGDQGVGGPALEGGRLEQAVAQRERPERCGLEDGRRRRWHRETVTGSSSGRQGGAAHP